MGPHRFVARRSRRWVTDLRAGVGARTGRVRTTPRRTPADDNRGRRRARMIGPRSPPSPPPSRRRAVALADDDSPSSAVPTPCNVVVAPARAERCHPRRRSPSPSTARRIRRSRPRARRFAPWTHDGARKPPRPPSAAVLKSRQLVLPQRGPPSARAHPSPRAALRRPRALPRVRPRARQPAVRVLRRRATRQPRARHDSSGGSAPAGGGSSGVGFGAVAFARAPLGRSMGRSRLRPSFAPHEVFDNLRLLAQHFVRYRQEDAHELLRLTLDAMDRSCLVNCGRPPVGVEASTPPTPRARCRPQSSSACFRAVSKSSDVRRMRPGQRRARSVSRRVVGTRRGVGSVDEAFDAFVAEETLEGENAYECERVVGCVPRRSADGARGARGVGGAPQTLRSLGRKNRRARRVLGRRFPQRSNE